MELSEYDNIARLEGHHWWYLGMRAIAERLVRGRLGQDLSTAAGRPAQILDAGCGTGGGLQWLAAYGQVTGIDYHPRAIQYAARVSARVCRGSIERLPFAAQRFDLVTSFEVLYHLAVADDMRALRELARVLAPGGWLLVRVPAHDWLRGAHDRQVHTRHRYSGAELRRKVAQAGLKVRRVTSVGLVLLPAAIVRRAIQRGAEAHTDVALPSPAVNRLLLSMMRLEGAWLQRLDLPAGLSVLALAQKSPA